MIPKHIQKNFETLCIAGREQALCVMECTDAKTGEPRYVLCAAHRDEAGKIVMTPFGHLCAGNPYDDYIPPDPKLHN